MSASKRSTLSNPGRVAAAVYARISLDKTGQALGVDRQLEACRRICRERGWTVAVEHVDNSVSASKARAASSAYAALLADVRAGRVGAVVVWDLDRLTRRPRELEDWIDLATGQGVRIVTADGEVDTATDNGRLFMRVKAAVAASEVERKAARQRAAHAQRVERGKPPVGPRAIGWERDGVTLVDAEAAAIRAAARQLLEGGSLRSVARSWNDAGFVTGKGQPWAPYSVRGVLLNPRLTGRWGRRVGRDRWEIVGPGDWPAILDEDTHAALSRMLGDPTRRTTPGTARVSLLAGIASCGLCGRKVVSGGTQRGVRTLKCMPEQHLARSAADPEAWVAEVVLGRLERPDAAAELVDAPAGPDVAQLRAELSAKRRRLADLAGLLADGTLSAADVRSASARLRAEVDAGEVVLADALRPNVLAAFASAEDVRARWDAADLDTRRAVVDALVEVTVYPPGRGARRFDPSSVRVVPRRSER